MPPIKGREKQGILSLRGIEDGEKIDAAVKAGAKSAVIMGAGLIGLEVGVGLMETRFESYHRGNVAADSAAVA